MLVGLVFAALPGEVSNQVLVHRSVRGFAITMANYVWFLALTYAVSRWLERRLRDRYVARLRYFLLYGFIGLAIEWFLLGVYPLQPNPVQLMLFSFWAGMAITPCIFTDSPASPELLRIRRAMAIYIAVWACISLLPFAIASLFSVRAAEPMRGFSMLVYGIGILGINYFVYRYLGMLKRIRYDRIQAGGMAASP